MMFFTSFFTRVRPVLSAVGSAGEIFAFGTLAWAFIFPDQAAEKWAQFQNKVEAAQQELVDINANLQTSISNQEIANALAAATEASTRAIAASNSAIEASAAAIAATNTLIAEQAVQQTVLQEATSVNTGVLANEAERFSAISLDFGAMTDTYDDPHITLFIRNLSTRAIHDFSVTLLDMDGATLGLRDFGSVGRTSEDARNLAVPNLATMSPEALRGITVCATGSAEGDDVFFAEAHLARDVGNSEYGSSYSRTGSATVSDAPSRMCAAEQ